MDDTQMTETMKPALLKRATGGLRRWTATPAVGAFLGVARLRDDPFPAYAALQRLEPRHDSPMGAWILSRHEDCAAVLRNPAMSVSNDSIDREFLTQSWLTRQLFKGALQSERPTSAGRDLMRHLLLFLDAPDHTRIRALVSKAFTPKAVASAEPGIRAQIEENVERLRSRGRMELISEFAYPLPARIICALMGVPPEDHEVVVSQAPALARALDPITTAEIMRESDRAVEVLTEYLDGLIESRRRQPADDLVSALITAEESGDRLSRQELLSILVLLLLAGHETTANLVGNGLLALIRHPEALRRWRDEPEVGRAGVEELLRFCGPIQMTQRITTEPTAVGTEVIPPGRLVILVIGAANRDPRVFDNPGELRLDRDPNPHLALSSGAHFCIGAPLARLEARLMLDGLVSLRELQVTGPVRWRESFTIRGLKALQLSWAG
jgi:pimeloyl-[acyl-carrier protein] synthase